MDFIIQATGALFTAITLGLLIWFHIRGADLKLKREWLSSPNLRIPLGEETQQTDRILECWRIFREHGAPCGSVIIGGESIPQNGEILVTGIYSGFDPEHAGEAKVKFRLGKRPRIVYAHLQLPHKATKAVILHEFGHAFGIGHHNKNGHVMAPNTDRGGESMEGIRELFFQERGS